MKYEAVFGDDGLFFDAQKDCEMAGNGHYKIDCGEVMVWNFTEKRWCNSHTNTITISAMRRIIEEPNRWTVEDQKAGRMPEVGCIVTTYDGKPYVFVGESFNNDQWSLRDCETGKVCHTPISWVLPIESPEEKAQREEDEFVKLMIDLASESQLMSCGFKDGVISAYRKLKGGA